MTNPDAVRAHIEWLCEQGMTHEEAVSSVSRCYDTPLSQVERAIAFGVAA